ncbi:MAG TPA: SIS domain-containing protein [Anaerolineales bacterium]|nr:SIS domain-containing protein [Anaerolineales bacterium]
MKTTVVDGQSMSSSQNALDQYFQAVRELAEHAVESQRDVLIRVAKSMAETTKRDQRIFLFGTGHSHLIAEEGFYRAGGLANVVPILTEHVMLHHLPSLGSRLERTPGLAELILERYAPYPEEMLFVFSNSGVNQLPVEMALRGRERGLFVVGVSSFGYAKQAPLSGLGLRLDQSVDLALDNCGIPGDGTIELDGFPWRVGPSSTVISALLWNGLVAETARLLLESGTEPPIFVSLNVTGAAQHNQALLEKWRSRNIHL